LKESKSALSSPNVTDLKRVSLRRNDAKAGLALETEEELIERKDAGSETKEKVSSPEVSALGILKMLKPLSGRGYRSGKKGLLSPNSTYKCVVSNVITVSADSSGIFGVSTRTGDPTIWSSYSTFAALFQRFRVVHVALRVMRAPLNSNIGVITDQTALYMDTTSTSVSPSSLAGVWASPGAIIYSAGGGGYGMQPEAIRPVFQSAIKPEQEWFDLSAEKQRGCIAAYGVGNTHSVEAQYWFFRYTVEFSGLLI
jgi:hypothetical protein